jgi:hypothetical protein
MNSVKIKRGTRADRASKTSHPQSPHEYLARTLKRASRIAAQKAAVEEKLARAIRQKRRRLTWIGAALVLAGVAGTFALTLSGKIQAVGFFETTGTGIFLVSLGAHVLSCRPHLKEHHGYARQARELAQLSRSLTAGA